MNTSNFAAESGHWYKPDGTPAYTVVGKTGERPTTLRDARKLGLVPSVTTIIRCAAAPGLERYKLRQLAESMATLPKLDGESWDDFIVRAETDSKEHSKQAAARGEEIHAAIERHHHGIPIDNDLWPFVVVARDVLAKECQHQAWSAERSFASNRGYGGKVDLHSPEWLLDVKTKDGPLDDLPLYDEHYMQLAAYSKGLGLDAQCGIVFVRRDQPEARFVLAEPAKIEQGWRMFTALLDYWYAKTGLAR